jgi:hypothetical protein
MEVEAFKRLEPRNDSRRKEAPMNRSRAAASPADVAQEGSTLMAGFGILTIQIFPFALPLLILAIGPFLPLALIVPPLVGIVVLPFWLVRTVVRRLTRRRRAPGPPRLQAAGPDSRAESSPVRASLSSGRP